MATSTLQIIINARDQATAVMKQFGSSMANAGSTATALKIQLLQAEDASGRLAAKAAQTGKELDQLKADQAAAKVAGLSDELTAATNSSALFEEALIGLGAVVASTAAAATLLSLKLATGFETATVELQNQAQLTKAQAVSISDSLLQMGRDSEFGGKALVEALTPVAGRLETVTGAALNTKTALEVMTAAGDLAEATNTGLADSTSALVNVMLAYQLPVSQAAAASDKLFNISRITGIGLDEMTTAVGRLKDKLGNSAPDLTQMGALLAELASQGLTGSRGLLAVSTAIETLTGGSAAVTKELSDLGVSIFDAQGNFIGLRNVIGQLQPAFAQMSDAQQNAAAKTLFGASASGVLINVIKGGTSTFDQFSQRVSASGTAAAAAAADNETFSVQMKVLKNDIEALATSFGQSLLPGVEKFTSVLTPMTNTLAENKDVMAAFAAVAGTVMVSGFIAAASAISRVIDTAAGLNILGTTMGSIVGKVGLLAAGFVALDLATKAIDGQSVSELFTSADEHARGATDATQEYTAAINAMNAAEARGVSAAQALGSAMRQIIGNVQQNINDLNAAEKKWADSPSLKVGGQVLIDFSLSWQNQSQKAKDAVETLKGKQDQLGQSLAQLVGQAENPIIALGQVRDQIDQLSAGLDASDPRLKLYNDLMTQLTSATAAAVPQLDDTSSQVGSLAYNVDRLNRVTPQAAQELQDIAQTADAAKSAADSLAQSFKDLENIFKRPDLASTQLQLQIDDTQALIDNYTKMGQKVPEELQKTHDALVANQKVANDTAKVAGDAADVIAAKLHAAGIPADDLNNVLSTIQGKFGNGIAIDVATKIENLDNVMRMQQVLQWLKDNPDLNVDVAIAVSGGYNIPQSTTRGIQPSFAEGGIGQFGAGQLAMLHGNEAILPLSKPARTQEILKQLGVRGFADGGYTTGNLPPVLQQQYDRLGLVSGASGGSATGAAAKADAAGLADLFAAFQKLNAETGITAQQFEVLLTAEQQLAAEQKNAATASADAAQQAFQAQVDLTKLAIVLGQAGISGAAFVAQQELRGLQAAFQSFKGTVQDFIKVLQTGLSLEQQASVQAAANAANQTAYVHHYQGPGGEYVDPTGVGHSGTKIDDSPVGPPGTVTTPFAPQPSPGPPRPPGTPPGAEPIHHATGTTNNFNGPVTVNTTTDVNDTISKLALAVR